MHFAIHLMPLQHRFELSLKMIAVLRLLMPDINIAAATALQAIDPLGREKAVKVGANVIMPNITPGMYRKRLRTLPEQALCWGGTGTVQRVPGCPHCAGRRSDWLWQVGRFTSFSKADEGFLPVVLYIFSVQQFSCPCRVVWRTVERLSMCGI
ncbi:hypothetical protein [Prolixibacter sp. SD074]|uniref:hypothetical protein n=1 Tax=Prolixibacter sp. SD074 TaxID=2652391 RepID=UPI001E31156E|nr:hypothetical protein [Prolixibacter sp. SD074]